MVCKRPRQNYFFSIVLLTASSIFVAGCNSSPVIKPPVESRPAASSNGHNLPDWVLRPPAQHRYAHGVGSAQIYQDAAKAAVEAQNNALQDLIGKMQVSVAGSTTIKTRVENSKLDKLIEDEVRSQIPEIGLKNAEFVKRFVDTENQYVYVLAQLDRQQAAFNISEQLADLDLSLLPFIDVPTSLPRLDQWRELKPALKLIEQRKQLSKQFNVIAQSNQFTNQNGESSHLEKRIFSLIDNLSISLNPLDVGAKTTLSSVTKQLTETGFRIANSSQPDLSVDLSVTMQSHMSDGTYYVFAQGAATIKGPSGRILSEYSDRAKGTSSISQTLAESRAAEHIGNSIGKLLASTLLEKI